ncbi:MAG: glutamate-5-semialdehyde dehydrogenase [Bdellovibrionaceae bacterium]|nr:glutamate-5-semialdehyde dehydrogenase [Bdellovibrionales bacterium]MCB9253235.1 glutamate-5-semialdehyde dehydrogenase [Pseudobdellovibrionaceae bacterium]
MTENEILSQLAACKKEARELRTSHVEKKNAVLLTAAELLLKKSPSILEANAKDLAALPGDASSAFKDRLLLSEERLKQAADSLQQVAAQQDPIGEEVSSRVLENGLKLRQVRSPLGVILLIFESRPNVALEAFSLAFKSGNIIILRGGKESRHSTAAIYSLLQEALSLNEMSTQLFWGITDPDRSLVEFLLKQKRFIDIVVPRGGEGLINYVVENARMPIIKNDRGLCHVYLHADADPEMSLSIVENAKTQRPGVCNAMETLLVHESIADDLLPKMYERLSSKSVRWFCCPRALKVLEGKSGVAAATDQNWDTEYLDYQLNCRVVPSLEAALEHIERHGSGHSESIVTASPEPARAFQQEVDCAAAYWNASTRFTDGFAFGLGGELGISTQKLHVRGPVGLRELTSARWIIDGSGQVR